jgi:hypothetical protein
VGLCPIQVHDLPLCRLFFETAPVLKQGEVFLEDRGCLDGQTLTELKQQRHIDGIVLLQSTMVSYQEAVQLAALQGEWQPHPSRDDQHIAFGKGVEHVWDEGRGALKAGVIRYWNRKKEALGHIVLGSTEQRLTGPWIVCRSEERPEIEQAYQQMKSGGGQLKQRSSTRYREIVLYILTVVVSYSLYHRFANTRAGARLADKTRQALAFEQHRSRRTPIMASVGGHFEIFATLSFVRFVLQLPAAVQGRVRHWFDERLHSVQQRK